MPESSISVVILNWNGLHYLKKFLGGVIKFSPGAEIVVADNASDDGSLEWIDKEHPEVRIIRFDKNHGFCGGYNLALSQINSDYCVLLNSDVEVTENWLNPLKSCLDNNTEIAAVQPKIKWQLDKRYFEYAGAAGGYMDKFGYPFCRGRILNKLEKDQGQYEEESDIFWATGACLVIRSKVYRELGGLDELFFAHMEEIDLCWRIHNEGMRIRYIPESTVYHIGGGTLPKSNPRKTHLNHRNSLLVLYKNLPEAIRSWRIFQRLLLDGLSGMIYLAQFRFGDFKALLKAHSDYRKMRGAVKVSDKREDPRTFSGFYNKSVLLDYFIRGKKTFSQLEIKNPRS